MAFEHLFQSQSQRRREHRDRVLVPRQCDGTILIEPDGSRLINFGSNDYLGLAACPDSVPDGMSADFSNGLPSGSTASALVCGWSDLHQQLADDLATLESTEAAVLFPSGFAACCGTVATLAEKGDLILSDALNHASLIDGCRLSRADCLVYPHRDVSVVEQLLQTHRAKYARVWIVTDTVFSMDGHTAPLVALCDLAEEHDATLIVDEAHATGVLGASGGGLCEHLGVRQRVAIRIGTLSKAIGAQGGFVAAPAIVVDHLINHCRTLIFSTALAPSAVAAGRSGLLQIRQHPERRERVRALAQRLRADLGLTCDEPENSVPIVPIPLGSERVALTISRELRELGFYVPAIRPPTVPENGSRLRISLSAAHRDDQLQRLTQGLQKFLGENQRPDF
ncbi:aminotransferase class I/II-fold pyridoxal phosphate-dependent enzyme [Stieleria varia]|uniref:8-amino-7-oxononanoate synthase n=1 Tax=Stieleria varia TaxID=2528005 RepID=A0A5C5ZY80_9BACT|nr:8-amino-7-oxononanoate synthase [Stieleria varia]TWT91263.1 8-amino-7-oxononanoate synthase [Stieleria varia]